MRYKLPNGQMIGISQPFTYDGTSYPSNWTELATQEQKDALGLTVIQEYPRPDDTFYWVTQNDDGTYNSTPKDMEDGEEYVDLRGVTRRPAGLRTFWTAQVKDTANKLLAQTDWMVIRKAERDVAIPDATVTYRAAVVAEVERLKTAIAGASDVPALIEVVTAQNWPRSE
jgi:hypothetical protein